VPCQIQMKKLFYLFPGQGAQYPGMALDFLETGSPGVRELFRLASEILGLDFKNLLETTDAETLKRTDLSQPAITLANLSAAAFLGEEGIRPRGCAGFSLGEYAALTGAGVLRTEDCFILVRERGRAMQAAADRLAAAKESAGKAPGAPGMAAVIGLAPERVEELLARWRSEGGVWEELFAANFNSSRQTVVSGTAKALEEAEGRFKEAGAKRFLRLPVAGPFHSPLLGEAAAAFGAFLEKTAFADPGIPFFSNVTGQMIRSGGEAKELALEQITRPVRWVEEERAILALGGFDAVAEAGPGTVLAGLWRDMGGDIPCRAAGTVEDCRALLSFIRG